MKPLVELPPHVPAGLRFLLADIDDTLTTSGRLTADAYAAIWQLSEAGIAVIPVTGRPAGWCDMISRQWPVAGVVGENGAFAFYLDESGHQQTIYHPAAPEPMANRERLAELAADIYRIVPGTRPAKDQFSRLFDVAVDFREEQPFLGLDEAEKIRAYFADHGAHAKVSSIHVNAWFGEYDKLSMATEFLRRRFNLDPIASPDAALFVGDSPNDEPLFAAFEYSVGVANIRAFTDSLTAPPAFVTTAESGAGFVELARHLLRFRDA